MRALRSLLFNAMLVVITCLVGLLLSPLLLGPRRIACVAPYLWSWCIMKSGHYILGISYEVRGKEHVPADRRCIFASKHQSAWETIAYNVLLGCPVYVLKRELLWLPIVGQYFLKMRMIAINRSKGSGAIKQMIRQGKARMEEGIPIIIFPEGTRASIHSPPHYHAGIAALYNTLNVPVIPMAVNTGLVWGRNAFVKQPGHVIIEFLPPIAPGLPKAEFMALLERDIETATQRLLENPHPLPRT